MSTVDLDNIIDAYYKLCKFLRKKRKFKLSYGSKTEDSIKLNSHKLQARLVDEHAPHGAVEEALVGQLALVLWRMRRVEALEVEALTDARERRPSTTYAGGYNPNSPLSWSPERMNTVLRYRAGLERGLHRTLAALAARRRTNEPGPRAEALHERTRAPEAGAEPNSQKREKEGRAPSAREAFRHLVGAALLFLACLLPLPLRWAIVNPVAPHPSLAVPPPALMSNSRANCSGPIQCAFSPFSTPRPTTSG